MSTNYFDSEEGQNIVDGDLQDKFIISFNNQKVFGGEVLVTNVSSVSQPVEFSVRLYLVFFPFYSDHHLEK